MTAYRVADENFICYFLITNISIDYRIFNTYKLMRVCYVFMPVKKSISLIIQLLGMNANLTFVSLLYILCRIKKKVRFVMIRFVMYWSFTYLIDV